LSARPQGAGCYAILFSTLIATLIAAKADSSGVQAAGGSVQAGANGVCNPEKQEAAQLSGDQVGGAQQLQCRLLVCRPHDAAAARHQSKA
jgi:hypothetical protein